ncbi:MAG TPA: hypothetical protein PLV68_10895 [Ilumatobacteraceae bacterium]|nr:hypothetical protein [Ilumatobacteraceae bacterium]
MTDTNPPNPIDSADLPIAAAVRAWADELAATVPPYVPHSLTVTQTRPLHTRRRMGIGIAAGVLIVAGFTAIAWMRLTRNASTDIYHAPSSGSVTAEPTTAQTTNSADPASTTSETITSTSAEPETTTTTTTTTEVPVAVDPTPVDGSNTVDGIEVMVRVPGEVVAGTRAAIEVTVTNHRSEPIYWQAGGCATPAEVTVGPISTAGLAANSGGPGRLAMEQLWDGNPDSLAPAIRTAAALGTRQLANIAEFAGWGSYGCTSDSNMQPIPSGGQVTDSLSAEVRVPPGPLADAGRWDVTATFVGYADWEGYPNQPLATVSAHVVFAVVDHPDRGEVDLDTLGAVIAADGRLADWYATTLIPGRPDLDQRHSIGLTWWRGAWELWVSPYWGSGDTARVRLDPATLAVTDVRIVRSGTPPDDEPDLDRDNSFLDQFPDRVLALGELASTSGATASPASASFGDTITITPHGDFVCDGMARFYRVNADGTTAEAGVSMTDQGNTTWNTPPEGSPITVPPCRPVVASTVQVDIPQLAPGDYLVCLTDNSTTCAPVTITP